MWQFIRPYKFKFFIATFLAIISSAMILYSSFAFSQIVNIVTKLKTGDSLFAVYVILITWLISIVIHHITGFLARYININVAEKAATDSELYAIKHISSLDMSWHEKENSGNKMKRIDRGSKSIVNLVRLWSTNMIFIVVTFIGAIIIISNFNKILAGSIIIYQIIYYFIASSARRRGLKALHEGNIKGEEITGLWYEIISNIRSIKVLGMVNKIFVYGQSTIVEYLETVKRRIFWYQGAGSLQGIWEGIARITLMAYVIWGILNGYYEIGFLILFSGYFNTLTRAVSQFTEAEMEIATAKASIGRLTDILDVPIVIDKEEGKVNFPENWQAVHVRDLSFGYGDNEVISNINLEIKKGQKIGIVGLSGAGKSTIFKLLLKEHESYSGEILIGDVPLKKIKKSSYVQHIAAVLQDTEVFNMSLKQNIFLANSLEEHNQELFDRSLTIAHVNDFLNKLPKGVDTLIGEKGIKLSGGEKQRLGIARAVFKKPEILFLDEATSHLDVESEQKIQDSLKKFFKDVTAIVIAHRLSTIREMDTIIVLENGKIIETGTFDELNAQSGRFRDFWDRQKLQ